MTTESNIGNPASLVKEPKKIRLLDKEVDNGFPWSKNSSACTKVLKSIIGNKLCRDFLDEPKAEDFDDYEIFVQEPLSLRMLQKRIQVSLLLCALVKTFLLSVSLGGFWQQTKPC